jgi:hypothetical protein
MPPAIPGISVCPVVRHAESAYIAHDDVRTSTQRSIGGRQLVQLTRGGQVSAIEELRQHLVAVQVRRYPGAALRLSASESARDEHVGASRAGADGAGIRRQCARQRRRHAASYGARRSRTRSTSAPRPSPPEF